MVPTASVAPKFLTFGFAEAMNSIAAGPFAKRTRAVCRSTGFLPLVAFVSTVAFGNSSYNIISPPSRLYVTWGRAQIPIWASVSKKIFLIQTMPRDATRTLLTVPRNVTAFPRRYGRANTQTSRRGVKLSEL